MNFYKKLIRNILNRKIISVKDKILIVAGGQKDMNAFLSFGFENVTISNLDPHKGFVNYEPYDWIRQDLENLSIEDEEYDWVFVHAGLHHCASPHIGLCEMLRVARKGVGVIESRDSLFNWLTNKLGLTTTYEIEPCILSGGKSGGLRNSHIPNYIYKWTENEVKKTTNSYLPHHKHKFHFYYDLKVPIQRLSMSKNLLKKIAAQIGAMVLPVFVLLFKKQGNLFGFVILKNIELQPWLTLKNGDIHFNMNYGHEKYNHKRYKE
ncbi:class I SAM-dependent methyltransferase [Seonamhaeicola sp. MEBiC1930]|uniref:methyltransferase domain-containing protein n=1 Tax=Seonamhaeicola sp. MEBiC01930 TaxID=2976768 RepID=UPI003254C103